MQKQVASGGERDEAFSSPSQRLKKCMAAALGAMVRSLDAWNGSRAISNADEIEQVSQHEFQTAVLAIEVCERLVW